VFNIVSSCAAAVQFCLGIVAATNDRLERDERLSDARLVDVDRYDVYYSKLAADWLPCDSHFDWVRDLTHRRTSLYAPPTWTQACHLGD